MALDDSTILKDQAIRPYHLTQLAAIYNGQDEDELTAGDNSEDIDTVKDSIEAILNTIGMSEQKDDLITALYGIIDTYVLDEGDNTDMKDEILVAVNTGILLDIVDVKDAINAQVDTLEADVTLSKATMLADLKTELDSVVLDDAANFPYQCVWCNGEGRYEKRMDPGADPLDTELKHCDPSDGFGRVPVQQNVIIIKPVEVTYP